MKNFTITSIETLIIISAHDDSPFYASDLGLNGGQIEALSMWGIIRPTGNKKEYTIPHPFNDSMLIKCQSREWVISSRKNLEWMTRDFDKLFEKMTALTAQYNELKEGWCF